MNIYGNMPRYNQIYGWIYLRNNAPSVIVVVMDICPTVFFIYKLWSFYIIYQ